MSRTLALGELVLTGSPRQRKGKGSLKTSVLELCKKMKIKINKK